MGLQDGRFNTFPRLPKPIKVVIIYDDGTEVDVDFELFVNTFSKWCRTKFLRVWLERKMAPRMES